MIETNLQEAIAKISMDEGYRKKLTQHPDQLYKDFGENLSNTLKDNGDTANLINRTIRPVSQCCSCTCAPA